MIFFFFLIIAGIYSEVTGYNRLHDLIAHSLNTLSMLYW